MRERRSEEGEHSFLKTQKLNSQHSPRARHTHTSQVLSPGTQPHSHARQRVMDINAGQVHRASAGMVEKERKRESERV